MRLLAFIVAVALVGCATPQRKSHNQFEKLSNDFIRGYLEFNPATAVQLGFHKYDGQLPIPNTAEVQKHIAWAREMERRANAIDEAALSKSDRLELRLLKTGVAGELFPLVETESWRKNPMDYATAISVDIYIKRNFAPLEQRVRSIIAVEKRAPKYYAAARANLEPSLAKPLIET